MLQSMNKPLSHSEILAIQNKLYQLQDLTKQETESIFHSIVNGQLDQITMTAFTVALKIKGETPAEIAGAASAVRQACRPFSKPDRPVVDSCGTGGDGLKTINISTAVSFVVASCGVPVAKHGNRSVSSKSGSADVLEELGVNIEHSPHLAERCLDEINLCFLYAPFYHQGIRHATPVRQALATRSVFNLLGPLVNPARPDIQLMGIYDPKLCKPVAETLGMLGCTSAMVVHGAGLDEVALHGPTKVAELRNKRVTEYEISPSDFGCRAMSLDEIVGGSAKENADAIKQVLQGRGMLAHQNIIAANSAALLYLYGKVDSLKLGMEHALSVIHSGKADEKLQQLAEMTHAEKCT